MNRYTANEQKSGILLSQLRVMSVSDYDRYINIGNKRQTAGYVIMCTQEDVAAWTVTPLKASDGNKNLRDDVVRLSGLQTALIDPDHTRTVGCLGRQAQPWTGKSGTERYLSFTSRILTCLLDCLQYHEQIRLISCREAVPNVHLQADLHIGTTVERKEGDIHNKLNFRSSFGIVITSAIKRDNISASHIR